IHNKKLLEFCGKKLLTIKGNQKIKSVEWLQLSEYSKKKKREWLELCRGYMDANKWIIEEHNFQNLSTSDVRDKKSIDGMYQEIRIWEKLAENEFEKLMKKYSVIINKYKYISTALLEMIYPSFL